MPETLPSWASTTVWPAYDAADNDAVGTGANATTVRMIGFPDNTAPTQLLPRDRRSIRATFDRRSDDRVLRRRCRDSAATAFALLTHRVVGRYRLDIDCGEPTLATHLAEVLDLDVAATVVLSGPARANQKPVLQLLDRRGRTLAYVKVAWNELTTELLERERQALTTLSGASLQACLVPRVLGHGSFGEGTWLAVSDVRVDRAVRPDSTRIAELAALIEATGPSWTGPTSSSAFVAGLVARNVSLVRASSAVSMLLDRHPDAELTLGAWHGDFVPWNIQSGRNGWAVWDWERYRIDVPIGFDRFHYRFNLAVHREGLPTRQAAQKLVDSARSLAPDLPLGQAERHAQWYLSEILSRYEHDAQLGGSGHLQLLQRVDDIADALRTRLDS